MKDKLADAFINLKRDDVLSLVKSQTQGGGDPSQILEELRQGMLTIMERYERREYPLTSVAEAIEIYKEVSQSLEPSLPLERRKFVGKVVIGTAQGDIHESGKNLFASMLVSVGFEVFDLGADVPPEKCVETLKRTGASVLCLSGIVTNGLEGMKKTVDAVRRAGLKTKVLIGGGVTTPGLKNFVGADAQTRDLVEGARICLSYV